MDGDRVLAEVNGNSNIYYTYNVDGSILSMKINGDEYFYVTNLQGDVILILDISGNIMVKYKYDAWGNIISKVDNSGKGLADINPYRYRGYRYDNETGWYYLNSRYYNPEIGRFINADGLVGPQGDILGHNMYAYCQNNPVMYHDPSGEWFWTLVGIGLSIYDFISNAEAIADLYNNPNSDSFIGLLGTLSLEFLFNKLDMLIDGSKLFVKGLKCVDDIKGAGKAVPSGNQYSNMFEATISGSSRSAHRNQANKQFFNALKSDPGFAKQVDDFLGYDTMKYMQSGKGKALLNPSQDWVWHHPADRAGVMHLVPSSQHTSPLFQRVMHPFPHRGGGHSAYYR